MTFEVEDLVVELDAARAADDDVDLLGLVVAVGEALALVGLDAHQREAGLLGVEVLPAKRASWTASKPALGATSSTSRRFLMVWLIVA